MNYLDQLRKSAARNRRIVALRAKGWTMERIAKQFGITRTRVYQVLRRDAPR